MELEEEKKLIRKVQKFLKRSSDRFSDDIDDQVRALEIAGGHFWNDEMKERWHTFDPKKKKDIIPTIPYNNIGSQVNSIASPFSRSPFHINVIHKDAVGKTLQDKITRIEQSNNAKNCYQRAATRSATCSKGWVVIGTDLDKEGKVIPNIEFISNQKMVAPDPDCITSSCEDAEEGAIISYISVYKARREYGEDVLPDNYPIAQPELSFADIGAWGDRTDKVQKVQYFCKKKVQEVDETGNPMFDKMGRPVEKTKVHMYTICGNKVIKQDEGTENESDCIIFDTDIIPIVCFAGYNDYDDEYGQVFTGYVQKMAPNIEMMSVARTMQAIRMRRCSNVRIVTGKSATVGAEPYFQDFENGSALTLAWNDSNGAAPPQIVSDTFQTGDISAVLQEERQTMQDCSGVNLAGIQQAGNEKTAYEVMQQQINSESNVQELYMNWESACQTIGKIMLGILNKGFVPEFTLEGGPSVITSQMKQRVELQAVQSMTPAEMHSLIGIRMAETIDSDVGKNLAQDIKANCGLKLTEGQDVGGLINACEQMKQTLDQTMEQLKQVTQQNEELQKQLDSANLALENQKISQQMESVKMRHDWEMDEANVAIQSAAEARKLEQEDRKLELEARRIEAQNLAAMQRAQAGSKAPQVDPNVAYSQLLKNEQMQQKMELERRKFENDERRKEIEMRSNMRERAIAARERDRDFQQRVQDNRMKNQIMMNQRMRGF